MKKNIVILLLILLAVPLSSFGTIWEYSMSGVDSFTGVPIIGTVTISDQLYIDSA